MPRLDEHAPLLGVSCTIHSEFPMMKRSLQAFNMAINVDQRPQLDNHLLHGSQELTFSSASVQRRLIFLG